MPASIDDLLAESGKSAPHPRLGVLEARVWATIAARRGEVSSLTLWGWRSATAALLLAIGLIVGGASPVQASSDSGIFSTQVALAPSTLLGEGP